MRELKPIHWTYRLPETFWAMASSFVLFMVVLGGPMLVALWGVWTQ